MLSRHPSTASPVARWVIPGYLYADGIRLQVTDVSKSAGQHLHHVSVLNGQVTAGDQLHGEVDAVLRARTRRNHSATHLLHAALREILGDHVQQKGSLVDAARLRFDFSHPEPVSAEQLKRIEQRVNQQIRANTPVATRVMSMDDAIAAGAVALFGEKYGDEVRVLSMGEHDFSVELCGGTHVSRTGDIGLLRIVAEGGVAAGVRRIEALTGDTALEWVDALEQQVRDVCDAVKSSPDAVVDKVAALRAGNRDLEKEVARLKQKLASSAGGDLTANAVEVDGVKVLAAAVDGADAKSLRDTLDQCKNKLGSGVILLASGEAARSRWWPGSPVTSRRG